MKGVEMCNSKDLIYLNGHPNIAFHWMTYENKNQKLKDLVVQISNDHFSQIQKNLFSEMRHEVKFGKMSLPVPKSMTK